MAQRPRPGPCIYCQTHFEELTWDHVFPVSWYPDSTPLDVEKWKVPCCQPCNASHDKNESNLLVRLGICLDPAAQASEGITAKILRAVSPRHGRNPNDSAARAAKGKKIRAEALQGEAIPKSAVFPGFEKTDDWGTEEPVAVRISAAGLKQLTDKIVRGVTYIEDGRLIVAPYRVQMFVFTPENAAPIRALVERTGRLLERGPGLSVWRAVAPEDGITSLYALEIWGRLRLYAVVDDEPDGTDA
jgi:hypothetical protein